MGNRVKVLTCRHCNKKFEDEVTRYVFLARFVQSRRERACFDYCCLDCGKVHALQEREYRRQRFSLDEEPSITHANWLYGIGDEKKKES